MVPVHPAQGFLGRIAKVFAGGANNGSNDVECVDEEPRVKSSTTLLNKHLRRWTYYSWEVSTTLITSSSA
jgi:hypothetical protein